MPIKARKTSCKNIFDSWKRPSTDYEEKIIEETPSARPNKKVKSNTKTDVLPLAAKVRPNSLDAFVGQKELVGENGLLRNLILRDKIPSMILWGPSGTGKTTLARIISNMTQSVFKEFSGITHVPYVESGEITLIGATTENPSFKINSALLSRCKVFTLNKLSSDEVHNILQNITLGDQAKDESSGFQAASQIAKEQKLTDMINDEALKFLAVMSDGDARIALNALEIAINTSPKKMLTKEDVKRVKQTIQEEYAYPVPMNIRNAPTNLMKVWCIHMLSKRRIDFMNSSLSKRKIDFMNSSLRNIIKDLGYGHNYKYNPEYEGPVYQEYLPRELKRKVYLDVYKPTKSDEEIGKQRETIGPPQNDGPNF
ncbi:5787_t:CDS:2 [Acaulospora colombiana]|uniref:5787_t:CDS:1 n=1 Tax=Acaulospora colombiana TaxID=27376 RepID=A0ACA9KS96_9GLOM|nr:5787_t:CDS:2 [Acaulospora colombiana]